MKNELSAELDSYIKRVLPQAKKELKYVKNEDWSSIESVSVRSNVYKIQNLLVDRNVKTAVKLYGLASEDLSNKRVKAALAILIDFFKVADTRYKTMIDAFDWTTFDLIDTKGTDRVKKEVEFQAEVLDDINTLENRLRAINFGGESDELSLSFHSDTPAPFMMSDMLEDFYPEIKDYLKRK